MLKMDLKFPPLTWVENIYQKLEAVCQEVDDIVSQDPVKYVENQVQNVGDSVKKFCSDVVQELLPSPVNSAKQGACSVALKDNGKSSKSTKAVEEIIERTEENPANNVIKSLHDSETTDLANNQQSHTSHQLDHVNQVSDQTSSNSAEMEDSYVSQDDILNRETSDFLKENLHVTTKQNTVESTPELLNLVSLDEKKPFESSVWSQYLYGFYDDGCGALAGRQEKSDVSVEQNSCVIVDENSIMSLIGKELFEVLFSESSDEVEEDACGILDEVSTDMKSQSSLKSETVGDVTAAVVECVSDASQSSDSLTSSEVASSALSCERSLRKMVPLCSESSQISNSQSAKSPESYSFETKSWENNSVDVAGCSVLSSIVLVSSAPISDVADLIESKEEETSRVSEVIASNNSSGIRRGEICSTQDRAIISLSDIDETLVNSTESSIEDLQLSDNAKLDESCVFVDGSEFDAVSCRTLDLKSYKKRIRDTFARMKGIEKEYEQLVRWLEDIGTEASGRPLLDSRNPPLHPSLDTDWELL